MCANRGLPSSTTAVGLVTLIGQELGDEAPGDLAYLALFGSTLDGHGESPLLEFDSGGY